MKFSAWLESIDKNDININNYNELLVLCDYVEENPSIDNVLSILNHIANVVREFITSLYDESKKISNVPPGPKWFINTNHIRMELSGIPNTIFWVTERRNYQGVISEINKILSEIINLNIDYNSVLNIHTTTDLQTIWNTLTNLRKFEQVMKQVAIRLRNNVMSSI